MKTLRNIVLFLGALILWSCEKAPEVEVNIHECAVMPSPRACACACSLNDKAYVFGGRNEKGEYLNDLWEYDSQTDTWTSMGAGPMTPRVNAAIISHLGMIYVGLGYAKEGVKYETSNYMRDWWRWNPMTNKWDSLAPYPTAATNHPMLYNIADGHIYSIYGTGQGFTREINYYDIDKDRWECIPDNYHRAISCFSGVGVQLGGKCYFGLGYSIRNLNQWYSVHLPTDQWKELSHLPSKGRTFSASAAGLHQIYVFGGRYFAGEHTGGELFADIWRYNASDDTWARAGLMPCGKAENQIAFSIYGKVYFGLGEDENGKQFNTIYRLEE